MLRIMYLKPQSGLSKVFRRGRYFRFRYFEPRDVLIEVDEKETLKRTCLVFSDEIIPCSNVVRVSLVGTPLRENPDGSFPLYSQIARIIGTKDGGTKNE